MFTDLLNTVTIMTYSELFRTFINLIVPSNYEKQKEDKSKNLLNGNNCNKKMKFICL